MFIKSERHIDRTKTETEISLTDRQTDRHAVKQANRHTERKKIEIGRLFGMAAMPFLSRGIEYFSYHRMVSWVINVPMCLFSVHQ